MEVDKSKQEINGNLITTEEAARRLGVSSPTISRYLQLGIIEGQRSRGGKGRPYLIKEASVTEARRSGLQAAAFVCSTPGCTDRAIFNSGRCSKHEAQVNEARAEADPHKPLCRFSDITGGADGCPRKGQVHGLCRGHYIAVRYSREWEHALPEQSRAPRCMLPSCVDPQMWGGLCRNHNQKVRINGGDLDEILRKEVDIQPLTSAAHEQFRLWRTLRGETMASIGLKMGLSRERVRQIENGLYARLEESVKASRQQGQLSHHELRYLKVTEFPVECLLFGSEEYV